MKTETEKATLQYTKTHCKHCTEDMPEGKPNRSCGYCRKLEDKNDTDGLAARRRFITSAREAKVRDTLLARAETQYQVTLNHVHLDLADGAKTIERDPITKNVHIQAFGGDTKLEEMVKAVLSGDLVTRLHPDGPMLTVVDRDTTYPQVATIVCDLAQALLDECSKRGGWYEEPIEEVKD